MGNAPLTVQARALRRAADILGGKAKLRAVLHVPMPSLEQWLDGTALPPMDVFLKAVDILSAPSGTVTPAAAAARARVLTRQSNEILRNTNRTISETRALRNYPRNVPSPKVLTFLKAVFGKDQRSRMLDSALEAAIAATQAQMGNIQLKDDTGLRIVTYRGFDAPFLDFFKCVSAGHGAACGAAMQTGARVIVSDVATDPIFVGTEAASVMEQANARACQSTPLISVSGQFLGMLSTHFDHPHRPAADELELVDRIAERTAHWLEAGSTQRDIVDGAR